MSTIRSVIGVVAVVAGAGCYSTDPAYSQGTFPAQPQTMYGPPGGGMDPGYGYQDPTYSQGYPDGSYVDPNAGTGVEGSADPSYGQAPQDPQAADASTMSSVTDAEIDATLQPYGSWVEDPDYGRVWRPDATVVGVDFTPYETCGSWVDTEYGWAFNCDWGWGWLPFHYGRWAWFDDYWGWVPGYQWAPAWVEWRHGGGYVGWRPLGPDHGRGPAIRDHRHPQHDSSWRFASVNDFGKGHVRSHLFQNPAEGLRVTQPVARPPRGESPPVRAATLMHARVANPAWTGAHPMPVYHGRSPQVGYQPPAATYQPPVRTYQPPVRTYQPPTYQPPVRTYQPPTYQPPVRTYQPPTYQPPTYQPPVRTYQPPSHPSFSPPSHSSFSPPSHSSFSPPSHSSFSPPSHSSFSPSSSGGGHSSSSSSSGHSSGGHSGGGGGHHR